MNKPLVSIIIPTFNRAHLIGKTLDSVLSQTYSNWECIVVDDGSTDDTDIVISKYCKKDSRFKYYKRPKNKQKGANSCRNYGFEKSKGKYVNWFDSDDLCDKKMLSVQYAQLHKSNKKVSICQSLLFNDNKISKTTGVWKPFKILDDPIYQMIKYDLAWTTNAALWQKSVIPNNPFDEDLMAAQEWLFHCKQMHRLKLEAFNFSDEVLVYVRKTKSFSIGNTKTLEIRNPNYLKARNKLIQYFNQSNEGKYVSIIFNSLSSLVTKIIKSNSKNKDLIEFEGLLKKFNYKKWLFYQLVKKGIVIINTDFKLSKRMILFVLKKIN